MLRSLFNFCCQRFFRLLFYYQNYANKDKSLYIFDIDNTLADTYPTLNQQFSSEKARLLSLKPFPRVVGLCNKIISSPSRKVVFLSVRPYKQWLTTITWLKAQGLKAGWADVIIAARPTEKVTLLKAILPREKKTVIIDDLSYNHEHGEVKYYENEIGLISKLPLKFIGYDEIRKFQLKK